MTDPDDRRSRSRSRSVTPPVAMPQPYFLAQQISADLNVSGRRSMAMLNMQPSTSRVSAVPANSISLNDPEDPFVCLDGPRDNLAPQRLTRGHGVDVVIPPEVQLPANWDAPLQHPMPIVQPMPMPLGRGHGNDSDVLTRTWILLQQRQQQREQLFEQWRIGREDLQCQAQQQAQLQQAQLQQAQQQAQLQQAQLQQAQLQQAQQQAQLQQAQLQQAQLRLQQQQQQQDDERRRREAETARQLAWARERLREAHQAFEDEGRQNLEARQGHSEAAASQPLPSLAQPQCNDYQAAVRQRDERWWQLFRNRSRNEQQAQQEEQLLQHNEEEEEKEEESNRLLEQRELIRRHQRLEDASNHMSRQDLAVYEAHHPREPTPPIPLPPHPPFQSINLNVPPLRPRPPVPARNPRARTIYHEPAQRHSLGAMAIECSRCHALHFAAEKLSNSTRNDIKFGMCCLSGQIILPQFPPPPLDLQHLFDGTSPHSLEFKTNIRQYNSTFAFTSLGVKIDHSVTAGSGPYSFRISGELHHLSGALLPLPNNAPVFAQIYIHDPNEQQDNNNNLSPACYDFKQ